MQPDTTARRGLRGFVLLVVLAVLFVATAISPASAYGTKNTPPKAAKQGARWISEQIIANHGYLTSFGSPDPSNTAYAVIGLRAAHVSPQASDLAIAYLKTQLTTALQQGGADVPANLAYYVMAVVVAGQNPTQFGGTGAANNLVARLVATQHTTGPDAGLFGTQDASFDGAFRQGLALAALKAAKTPARNPAVVTGLAWLTAEQCASGLWEPYRASTATPCDAPDPNFFTGPDTNSTAMAAQGLAVYGKRPLQAQLVTALHGIQSADGGFPYIAAPGQTSDPDSTALVIQALVAEQQHPARPEWAVAGGAPLTALMSYQLGCTDAAADRGVFFYPGFRAPNTFASVQSIPALMQRKFPLANIATMSAPPAPLVCGA